MGPEISFWPHKKMNFSQYEKTFRIKATKIGFSEEEITACLNYAEPLISNKLPVIYSTANLAALVGYKTNYLKRAVKFTKYFYRDFQIKKKDGKLRTLYEPLPSLKEIQSWVLKNILSEVKPNRFAKAYIKNKSLIENVKYHKGREGVLTLDILDFFGSIKTAHVAGIFSEMGYSANIASLLAKLCTYDGYLPQGAPTSPYLSNLYLKNFDDIVSKYCSENNIKYTRYADDMTFSGKEEDLNITSFIEVQLFNIGLYLNSDKSKLMKRNEKQVVTGIVVNDKLQVPREDRDFIRNEVHFLTKFGLNDHLNRTLNKKANYIEHLLGKINFALHINPDDLKMKRYKAKVIEYAKSIEE
ncbi:reverse transcriptase family protein [Pedobacter zeae]|uniref:RNA-directed DNA polymerase n=1 Tax=Pedobacter zeae TaxID=1737356 RepID=A0A7W6P5Z0_9SPHI|nr:reverse transcriptase family protein [Pedobacter zeae]MBB4107481.1 RNA-directed DNA polymerase [Pedobacter zeae]GGG99067.1 RNA-directed DNA polymerase [Pedobacter zeae]